MERVVAGIFIEAALCRSHVHIPAANFSRSSKHSSTLNLKTLPSFGGEDCGTLHFGGGNGLERRKLLLMVREAPLDDIHLENMLKLSRMGVVITPPVPAFYNHPQSVDDMVNHIVMRALDQFGIHTDAMSRWDGLMKK